MQTNPDYVSPRDLTKDDVQKALDKLPEDERAFILEQADMLIRRLKQRNPNVMISQGSALELIAKIGVFIDRKAYVPCSPGFCAGYKIGWMITSPLCAGAVTKSSATKIQGQNGITWAWWSSFANPATPSYSIRSRKALNNFPRQGFIE